LALFNIDLNHFSPGFFFCKQRARTRDKDDKTEKMIMPAFPGAWATSGANMVAILAKKLQMPIAVAEKRVGNIFACEI
jgi:hypothetical protein